MHNIQLNYSWIKGTEHNLTSCWTLESSFILFLSLQEFASSYGAVNTYEARFHHMTKIYFVQWNIWWRWKIWSLYSVYWSYTAIMDKTKTKLKPWKSKPWNVLRWWWFWRQSWWPGAGLDLDLERIRIRGSDLDPINIIEPLLKILEAVSLSLSH